MKKLRPKLLWRRLRQTSSETKLGVVVSFLLAFGFRPSYEFVVGTSNIQLSVGLLAFVLTAVIIGLIFVKTAAYKHILPVLPILFFLAMQMLFQWNGPRSGLLFLLWVAIVVLAASRMFNKKFVRGFIYGLFLAAIFSVALGVLQIALDSFGIRLWLSPEYTGDVFGFARAQGLFEEPQFLASFLILPLFASLIIRPKYWRLIFMVCVFGVTITMSRGAAVAMLTGTLSYLWLSRSTDLLKTAYATSAAIILGLIVVGATGYVRSDYNTGPTYFQKNYLQHMLGQEIDNKLVVRKYAVNPKTSQKASGQISSAGSRVSTAKEGWELVTRDRNWFFYGHGLSGYDAYKTDQLGTTGSGKGYTVNNMYLETWLELGLIGLSMLFAWTIGVIGRLIKLAKKQDILALALTVMLVAGSTQQLFFSSLVNNLHYWLLLILATSYVDKNNAPDLRSKPKQNRLSPPKRLARKTASRDTQ
ncbi:O-antigen ligase family protein [Candidatus Saccharibacteria bacterium]|nr:O-antigen ligase family protein [Candidatus Saccharibacteria bacterium]MCB9821319.1 O-antigen ligase family protein [Candidatus Nomurabacteria bacterium]